MTSISASLDTSVAVVGAGPYGLSVAAHLAKRGIDHRVYGQPMGFWSTTMPAGMFLKSEPFASNLSDPDGVHTLRAFAEQQGYDYQDVWKPTPLDLFIAYGRWFQQSLVPHLDQSRVIGIHPRGNGFQVTLADGSAHRAAAVVMACGLAPFTHVPEPLRSLPRDMCRHTSTLTDPAELRGRDVTVVGAGQSALESAALLAEHGATVRVLVRKPTVAWNSAPPGPTGLRRMRQPRSGLGTGWPLWVYAHSPTFFRQLPASRRAQIARTALGPAGSWWLRDRIEGSVEIFPEREIESASASGSEVQLKVRGPEGVEQVETEHVIAATGYHVDLDRMRVLGRGLRSTIATFAGSPVLGRGFVSSVPGLHFVGVTAAASYGPSLRFVYGTDHAARSVARHLSRPARTVGWR